MALPMNISSGHSPCSLFLGLLLCLHGQATRLRQCRPVPAQDPSLFGLKVRVCAVCSPAAPRAQGLFPPVFGAVGQLCQGKWFPLVLSSRTETPNPARNSLCHFYWQQFFHWHNDKAGHPPLEGQGHVSHSSISLPAGIGRAGDTREVWLGVARWPL